MWTSLNFYKEYLFGFEILIFATLGILSMHEQLVTLQREKKTWNRNNMTPLNVDMKLAEYSNMYFRPPIKNIL